MNECIQSRIKALLLDVIGDHNRVIESDSRLLEEIPELDSMALVNLMLAMEDTFNITIEDDEVDPIWFNTLATLTSFIESKINKMS